jgi:hypothetical protein
MIDRPRALCYWQPRMNRFGSIILVTVAGTVLLGIGVPSAAIEVRPTNANIRDAITRGIEAAQEQRRPDVFHVTFGSADAVHPGGFLLTKLGSLSVMAAHMALRGTEPSQSDIDQVINTPAMLVSTVIFGETPSFAVDSYMVLEQEAKTIKPATVRVDGMADRSAVWPNSPRFKAKVVGSFNYADFDPTADTTIIVYPAGGGEIRFAINFADVK